MLCMYILNEPVSIAHIIMLNCFGINKSFKNIFELKEKRI